jgi:hypothetical protein
MHSSQAAADRRMVEKKRDRATSGEGRHAKREDLKVEPPVIDDEQQAVQHATSSVAAQQQRRDGKTQQQQPSAPAVEAVVPERLRGRLGPVPGSREGSEDLQAAAALEDEDVSNMRWQPAAGDDDVMPDLHERQAAQVRCTSEAAATAKLVAVANATGGGGKAKQLQQPAPKQPPKLASKQLRQQEVANGRMSGSPAIAAAVPPTLLSAGLGASNQIFEEFAEVWYYQDEGQVIGPKSIRMLRRLARNLPPEMKVEMDNMECFTKQHPPEFKLLKHLLRFGDSNAPEQ